MISNYCKLLLIAFLGAGSAFAASPLVDPIHKNDIAKVERLLQEGAPADTVDDDIHSGPGGVYNATPIMHASRKANKEIFELLVKHGADPRRTLMEEGRFYCPFNYRSVLCFAALSGNMEFMEWYLEKYVKGDIAAPDKRVMVTFAVRSGNLEMVKRMIELGGDVNHVSRGSNDKCALAWAADRNSIPIMKLLLEAGADPDAYEKEEFEKWAPRMSDWSPLALGEVHSLEALQLLLDAGASLDTSSEVVCRAILSLATEMNPKAGPGRFEALKYLITQKGIPPDLKDKQGNGLISYAAGSYDADAKVLAWLAEQDGFIMPQDFRIWDRGIQTGKVERVRLLLAYGLDPDLTDKDGNTTLMRALNGYALKIAEFLIENGVNIEARNLAGKSALQISGNSKEKIALLKKYGAKEY